MNLVSCTPIDPHLKLLGSLYLLLVKIRKEGFLSVEDDIEAPRDSKIFTFLGPYDESHQAIYTFACDLLRMMCYGNLDAPMMARYVEAYRRNTDLGGDRESLFELAWLMLSTSSEGNAPQVCAEFGRQGIPAAVKPSFNELDDFLRELKRSQGLGERKGAAQLEDFFKSIGYEEQGAGES